MMVLLILLHSQNRNVSDVFVLFQCNMDYFTGNFNIGMCLHACGVATDQVLQRCIDKGADFVICPCCYGAIRDTQNIKYPRSNTYRNCSVSYQVICPFTFVYIFMDRKNSFADRQCRYYSTIFNFRNIW